MEIKNKLDEINKKMGKKDLNINPSADIHTTSDKPRPKIAQSCIFESQKTPTGSSLGGPSLDQLFSQKKSNAFGVSGTTPKNEQTNAFGNLMSGQNKQESSTGGYAFQNITSAKNIKEEPK